MVETGVTAIMLLDNDSRLVIKTNISIFGNQGIRFIENLDEITDEFVEYSHNLIVLEGFMQTPSALANLELYRQLYALDITFLGSSQYFDSIGELAYCFECNLATLDIDVIQSALYRDSAQIEKSSPNYFSQVKTAQMIVDRHGEYKQDLVNVAKAYLAVCDLQGTLGSEKRVLEEHSRQLKAENEQLQLSYRRLMASYREIIKDAKRMNRSLKRFESIFTQDVYDKIRLHDYVNRPLVLYFKEYEDFIGLDSMIETLVSVFKLQERKSVKVVRLFDSSSSKKILTVPTYYKVLHNHYLGSDIIGSEFICKSGNYKHLLDKILLNEVGLNVLIIVDSKDYEDIVISGTTGYFSLCRSQEHADAFGLSEKNTLINFGDDDSERVWSNYETTGMSNNEKMVFLSSKPIIRNILELSRMFAQTV